MKKTKTKSRIGLRKWLVFIIIGFVGQVTWNVENMYLTNFIFSFGYKDYHFMVSLTVAISAIVAFISTFFMGALSDRLKKRKLFISIGYILWGIATASFGLINNSNVAYLFPLANAGFLSSIFVIVIDAIMTFFGSASNDAAFNAYVTEEVSHEDRGKVEGVLSILPLISMLLLFGVLNTFTENDRWDIFFYIVGGLAFVTGIISLFLIPKEVKNENKYVRRNTNYIKQLFISFKLKSIKENKVLYINLFTYLIYAIGTQVFFSYMITYFQYSLNITGTNFTIIMGSVLFIGSILTVLCGFLMDKVGKNKLIIPSLIVLFIGCLLVYSLKKEDNLIKMGIYGTIMIFGYIFVGTVLSAITRDNIPNKNEGSFMSIRMLFITTLPMVIGSIISGSIIENFATDTYIVNGETQNLPPAVLWLIGGIISLCAIIPTIFYFYYYKRDKYQKSLIDKENKGLILNYHVHNFNYSDDFIPLNIHPDPSFKRNDYLVLNGLWDFKTSKDKYSNKEYKEKILVPFAVESPLSKINRLVDSEEYLFYHKEFILPPNLNKKHIFLKFLGVDQYCEVYINNKFAYKNNLPYVPFVIDIKEFIKDSDKVEIKLICLDQTDLNSVSRGKQSLNRGGIWYSPSSGVYYPIYLEACDSDYIIKYEYKYNQYEDNLTVKITTNKKGICKISFDNEEFEIETNKIETIKLNNIRLWSLTDPYLYKVTLKFNEDIVYSYAGIRSVEILEKDNKKNLYLNSERIILKGVLDQGYYYGGNLTPKNYDDYLDDILNLKNLGFNTIRMHIKFELPMFYYYCDKYGMLLVQDMINGGNRYDPLVTASAFSVLSKTNNIIDRNYKKFARTDEYGRNEFSRTLEYMVHNFHKYPSVIVYTIFNEGWGQFDASDFYKKIKDLNINVLIDLTSGWYDNSNSDFLSKHIYYLPIKDFKDKEYNRPYFLSEFGGYSLQVKDHFYGKKKFGYKFYKNEIKLTNAYKKLVEKVINKCLAKNCIGFIYTQLNDVEDEVNGLYTFDRQKLKIDETVIKELNAKVDDLVK